MEWGEDEHYSHLFGDHDWLVCFAVLKSTISVNPMAAIYWGICQCVKLDALQAHGWLPSWLLQLLTEIIARTQKNYAGLEFVEKGGKVLSHLRLQDAFIWGLLSRSDDVDIQVSAELLIHILKDESRLEMLHCAVIQEVLEWQIRSTKDAACILSLFESQTILITCFWWLNELHKLPESR